MRAAMYHGPRDVRVEDFPEPGALAPGDVRLRVVRAALCGSDAGEYAHGPRQVPLTVRHPGSGHLGPMVLGHEFTGVVEEVGSGVVGLTVGTRVVPGAGMWCGSCRWCESGRTNLCAAYYTFGLNAHGALTQRINVPELMCRTVPDGCGNDAAAMAQPLAVALHAVRRAAIVTDETVVLIGVGGIGFFILAGLVARAARVVVFDVDEERLAQARRFGASETLNVRSSEAEERIAELQRSAAVTAVIEASGAPSGPVLAQRIVARGGRILVVGMQKQPLALDLADLVIREITAVTSNAHVCGEDLPEALTLLCDPTLSAGALDRVVALEAIVEDGLEPLAGGKVTGKVLVDVTVD